ncbi:MAG: helix-turn-helix domain-containing protein [Lachnospiraceae bacterium]|nr:helix-turn-helix domain-containing protein [Lachnospiraceae bacterium]
MTIGQKIFYLLDQKNMTQKEFSDKTGIATTTISDWRKKNTNPGSDKILSICAALEVTPEFLLSGVTEDSERGKDMKLMVIPKGTEERELIELYSDMDWIDRTHFLEYARRIIEKKNNSYHKEEKNMTKLAEFCNIEVYIDSTFEGEPFLDIYYADDDVMGNMNIATGELIGDFSKYVVPVIKAWFEDNKAVITKMWTDKKLEVIQESE